MKILVILNHKVLPKQKEELEELGYDTIVYRQHPKIDPTLNQSEVQELFNAIAVQYEPIDALWVQGDFRFFTAAIRYAMRLIIPLFIATTERKSVEQTLPNGLIQKTSVFEHVRFVKVV